MAKTNPSRRSSISTHFESLAFQVEPAPRDRTPRATAVRALRRAFPGETWVVFPLNADRGEFEAIPVARGRQRSAKPRRRGGRPKPVRLSVAQAWDLSYRLKQRPEVVYAEPLFEIEDQEQHVPSVARAGPHPRSAGTEDNDPGTEQAFEWNLTSLHVREAWDLFEPIGIPPGDAIVIGHPDTGYTDHPEIMPRLTPNLGFDFEDDDADPSDPLVGGAQRNPGHGTATSSVIISPPGKRADRPEVPFVSGVSPGSSLIPIRTTKSVVLWSMSRLTRAIRFAIDRQAHVVSISLGGPFPSTAIHNAVRDAEQAGLIVCCAAGNQVRFVVFPAAFDEVIAVAASRIDDDVWSGSCRGPAVDITAPGSSVWRARTQKDGATLTFDVQRGSGTSYAVAQTAGLAALWLSFHGRDALIARYGTARLAAVFKHLLQQSCRTPAGWNTGEFGPGIAHAQHLLQAVLPSLAPAAGLRGIRRRTVSSGTMLDVLVHQLAPAPRSGVVRVLATLLHEDEEVLPEALEDVGQELAMHIGLDRTLREQVRAAAELQVAPTAGRAAQRRRSTTATVVRRRLAGLPASRRLRARLERATRKS